MDEQMFCFQCEQAAGCTACTGAAGVCGKSAETAAAQDAAFQGRAHVRERKHHRMDQ